MATKNTCEILKLGNWQTFAKNSKNYWKFLPANVSSLA